MTTATSRSSTTSAATLRADTTANPARELTFEHDAEGSVCRFHAGPGLYQLSIVADARDYDWEQTYVHLHEYQNKGQRTGPWDFELGTNRPLVPAYWVHLDGRRLGMWFFQRVSLDDIAHRRFRGNTAFHITEPGEHEIKLVPYQPGNLAKLRWLGATLEPDPEDQLAPLPAGLEPAAGSNPVAEWASDAFWAEQRRKLESTHARFREPLQRAVEWAAGRSDQTGDQRVNPANDIPLLVAGERLGYVSNGIERAIALLDEAVARPHWGKANEDGYGHNGDMGASLLMRTLAWAEHIFRDDELGADRRRRLREKLAYQGDRFFEQALLTRDYWGGSLRQDHGWRSIWNYATAALLLYGVVPEAERWVSYALPRMRRSLNAMARDGMIPPSSHHSLYLYLDEMAVFRRTLLAMTGIDIYHEQLQPLCNVIRFVCTVRRPGGRQMITNNPHACVGGLPFFTDIAHLLRERDPATAGLATWLLHDQLADEASVRERAVAHRHHSVLWGFFGYDPDVAASEPDAPPRRLTHFADDARVHYHDRTSDATLFVRCGPQNGYHAYVHAPGPCDRMEGAPVAGHFNIHLGDTPMLVTPVPGYRLKSLLGSILLIDDQGQLGDGDYPMSIPSWRHPGEQIRFAHWDEAAQRGWVRLELKPAYPESLGVAHYTRDLIIEPERRLICRDRVALDQPRTLSWLFQADREIGIRLDADSLRAVIGQGPALSIEPAGDAPPLEASIEETDVVHNYTSSFHSFDHVRYQTTQPVRGACVDFVFDW